MPLLPVSTYDVRVRCTLHVRCTCVKSSGYGFALQERSLAFGTPEEMSELARAFLLQFPTKEYPRLAELTLEHVLQPGYDYGDEYEFGLDLLLDGIERNLAQE